MRTTRIAAVATVLAALGFVLGAPGPSAAQGYVVVFAGGNFGGDSGVSLDESIDDSSRLNLGARLGGMGGGIFGGEIDVGYTPNFYGKGTVFDASRVVTITGNLVLAVPAGPVRPYGLLGLGLVRRTVHFSSGSGQEDLSDSRAAYSLGGGVTFLFGSRVGVNADLRYFRNFSTGNALLDLPDEHFDFARGSVGIVIRF